MSLIGFGFLCFGASAGLITGFLVSRARTTSVGLGFFVTALLPVFLSGAAVFMLPQLAAAKSTGFYPAGLLLSLLWQQAGPLMMRCVGQSTPTKWLVFTYGGVTLALTIAVLIAARLDQIAI